MITFSRTLLVGVESVGETALRFHGILEDRIYAMEVEMDVEMPEAVIIRIQGWMKRYTTPVCPKAVDYLQKAVGVSLRDEDWIPKLKREVGQKGCQHFAEILVECGRCLDSARMAQALEETLKARPLSSEMTQSWVNDHPEVKGSCMARP
jgi:hypothetical protein